MKDALELIVIGDDYVRDNVYSSFSTSIQEKKSKTSQRSFPSTFRTNDNAISLSNSTHAEFALSDKKIKYGIRTYTNDPKSLNFTSPVSFLHKGHSTVIVCISTDETDLEPNRFNYKIDQFMHLSNGKPFNIIPIIVTNDGNTPLNANKTHLELQSTYPLLCRKAIIVNSQGLSDPEKTQYLSTTLDVTLATPMYNEIRNCINLLSTLEENLDKTPTKRSVSVGSLPDGMHDRFDVASILNILKPSLNMIGSADVNTMDSLRAYFNGNREKLNKAFTQLKDDLNQRGERNQIYTDRICLNILCLIAAVVVSLTIVGIPFVYYALSQNSKYHNNYLKFFATNNVDVDRASIVKVEDEMNRTVLSAY